MSKLYLVTGGTGFIGSSLVKALVSRGDRVRVLDNNSRGHARRLIDVMPSVDFIQGDIRDPQVVIDACIDVDIVVHLAYVNGTEFFYSSPELVLDVAIKGMINIIEACKACNVRDLVLASSSEVYQTPPVIPTPEDVPLIIPDINNPRYSYGGGKILCELMAMNYGRSFFNRVVIFRPHNVYGPDMGWEHVIPQLALKSLDICSTQPSLLPDIYPNFQIKGNGQQTRAFIYIDDFIHGVLTVIDKADHLSIYHIGTRDEISISELAQSILSYYKLRANILTSDPPSGETSRRCPDISALEQLGFTPSTTFSEGLASTLNWYQANINLRPQSAI